MAAARGKSSIKSPKNEIAIKSQTEEKNSGKTNKKTDKTDKKRNTSAGKSRKCAEKKMIPEISAEEKRRKAIRNEVKRLTLTFKDIPSEKRRLVKATIEDAAFLTISMQELRDQIAREGMQVEYKNGENQYGTKQSPAVLSYLAMSQKLAAAMKILLDCQPKTEIKEIDDKFDDFIVERGND